MSVSPADTSVYQGAQGFNRYLEETDRIYFKDPR